MGRFRWGRWAIVNRTQALVIGFVVVALAAAVVVYAVAPEIYDQALRVSPGHRRWAEAGFLVGLTALIALLSVGVLRRWRWIFWLVLVAFLAGALRIPVAVLQLTGVMAASTPRWYVALQGVIGVAQFAIGLAMLAGYRRAGPWGAF